MQRETYSIVLVVGVVAALFVALLVFRRHLSKREVDADEAAEVHRGPGQSVLQEIQRLTAELVVCRVAVVAAPVLIAAAHLLCTYYGQVPESPQRIAVSAVGGTLFMGYYFLKMLRLTSRRRRHQLGYDDEVAVANALQHLTGKGYQVYHDFPGDRFKIDHIVIGPTGVMAVDTNTRDKGAGRRRRTEAVVTYDGRMLHFPKYSDHQIIDQAKEQAAWFSEWISSAVGEDIAARAMVALPGWFVKRTSADGIPVVNPKQLSTLFEHIKPRPLSASMIERIAFQIEKQCRNADLQDNSCYILSQ